MMNTLTIRTVPSYNVLIDSGLLDRAGEEIARVIKPCRAVLVADDAVNALYGDRVQSSLAKAGFDVHRWTFAHGEQQKSLKTYQELLSFACSCSLTRNDIFVALGGGVTGDLTGFAAATYLRGVRYVQLPTTLLAMTDSSIGGKTAVDLPEYKNVCGAFHQPALVLCDPDALSTLSDHELNNGVAECIKHAVLADADLLPLLANTRENAQEIIARCIAVKAHYVAQDEFDRGERQYLNLGHTVGHAVEALSGYTMDHGECVSMGLIYATRIAQALGICDETVTERIVRAMMRVLLPMNCPFSAEQLYDMVLRDKKCMDGSITWVLPKNIGECVLYTAPVSELRHLLALGDKK